LQQQQQETAAAVTAALTHLNRSFFQHFHSVQLACVHPFYHLDQQDLAIRCTIQKKKTHQKFVEKELGS
jgi:hypothetical protein